MECACYFREMLRRISLVLTASLALFAHQLANAQDNSAPAADPSPIDTNAPAANQDDVIKLKAENAALKKQAADAAQTISQLQAELAKAGIHNRDDLASTPDAGAASTGPQKALPLDATNAVATPAAPGTDTGPSKTYTVVKGDSLWKIAHKMYPHDTANGEDKIRDANKDVFNGKFLQPGQVLVIPQ